MKGADLDEFSAHRFLEKQGEQKTVVQMRADLQAIDQDSNARMALVEYLLWVFKKSVTDLESKKQGIVPPELESAKKHMAEVQAQIDVFEGKKAALRKKIEEFDKAGQSVKAKAAQGELKKLEDEGLPEELVKKLVKAESDLEKAKKIQVEVPMPGSSWWALKELALLRARQPKHNLTKP